MYNSIINHSRVTVYFVPMFPPFFPSRLCKKFINKIWKLSPRAKNVTKLSGRAVIPFVKSARNKSRRVTHSVAVIQFSVDSLKILENSRVLPTKAKLWRELLGVKEKFEACQLWEQAWKIALFLGENVALRRELASRFHCFPASFTRTVALSMNDENLVSSV